jgi:hypothetical protein
MIIMCMNIAIYTKNTKIKDFALYDSGVQSKKRFFFMFIKIVYKIEKSRTWFQIDFQKIKRLFFQFYVVLGM